jgi:hypothetical protein
MGEDREVGSGWDLGFGYVRSMRRLHWTLTYSMRGCVYRGTCQSLCGSPARHVEIKRVVESSLIIAWKSLAE